MPLSSFEVAMKTMASVVSDYLQDKNGVPKITKDGLKQLVREQFPHCEKKESSRGVYEISIPLDVLPRDPFSPTVEGTTFSRIELKALIRTKKLTQEKWDDAASQDFMRFPDSDDDEDSEVDFSMFLRLVKRILTRHPVDLPLEK